MTRDEINANFAFIRNTLEKVLPKGLKIYDIVYRPFNMGVFGSKGYSFVLGVPKTHRKEGCSMEKLSSEIILKGANTIIRRYELWLKK